MNTQIDIATDEPVITMSRIYDAPRPRIWEAMTEAKHVKQWWGGPGFSNPVCEMDVRVGGLWTHVMRFPDGHELHMKFVFLEVEAPTRLVWENAEKRAPGEGPPTCRITTILEDMGTRTRWHMVARFRSLAERDIASGMGFTAPIAASNERLTEYLKTM
jgi:uncharacterized protein YndB with AHSA1/START domain